LNQGDSIAVFNCVVKILIIKLQTYLNHILSYNSTLIYPYVLFVSRPDEGLELVLAVAILILVSLLFFRYRTSQGTAAPDLAH
jgi:hypothetical protein